MKFDSLILDFDGTLCATRSAITACLQETFRRCGAAVPEIAKIEQTLRAGISLDETLRRLQKTEPAHQELPVEGMIRSYREIYNGGLGVQYTALFPGATDTLRTLRSWGLKIILVSNKGEAAIRDVLVATAIESYFAAIICDDSSGIYKPDARLFEERIAPRVPGVVANRVLVVGDTPVDLVFAKRIGAKSCWAAYGYGTEVECAEYLPDFQIGEFKELLSIVGG
jgi:phosphoglycolate phosphatase